MSTPKLIPAALTAVLLAVPPPAPSADTRSTMQQVFEALAELLPAMVDEDAFFDPQRREAIRNRIGQLERSADQLEAHAAEGSLGFRSLARSFTTNVRLLSVAEQSDRADELRYLLMDLTQNCVACHSRLPAGEDFPLADRLMDRVDPTAMERVDLARLQIATRRFHDAMTTLESILDDPAVRPVDMDVDGVIHEYLSLGIRVLGDSERLAAALRRFGERPDTPYFMRRHADRWIESLRALAPRLAEPPSLEAARALFREAGELTVVPAGRERLAHDLAASSLLHRLLDDDTLASAEEQAEAYYMLAIISMRSADPRPAVPDTELLLAAAIRSAPHGPLARDSYALLEEYNQVSYAGIGMAELPAPILDMDRLRALIGLTP